MGVCRIERRRLNRLATTRPPTATTTRIRSSVRARTSRGMGLLGRRWRRWWGRPWRRRCGHPVTGHELPRPVGEVLPVRRCPSVARPKCDPASIDPRPLPVLPSPVAWLPGISRAGLRNVNDPWRRWSGRAHNRGGENGRLGGEEEEPPASPSEASRRQDRQENNEIPGGDHRQRPHRSKPHTGSVRHDP